MIVYDCDGNSAEPLEIPRDCHGYGCVMWVESTIVGAYVDVVRHSFSVRPKEIAIKYCTPAQNVSVKAITVVEYVNRFIYVKSIGTGELIKY